MITVRKLPFHVQPATQQLLQKPNWEQDPVAVKGPRSSQYQDSPFINPTACLPCASLVMVTCSQFRLLLGPKPSYW